eukprot:4474966-Amphidinium_carterae.1
MELQWDGLRYCSSLTICCILETRSVPLFTLCKQVRDDAGECIATTRDSGHIRHLIGSTTLRAAELRRQIQSAFSSQVSLH